VQDLHRFTHRTDTPRSSWTTGPEDQPVADIASESWTVRPADRTYRPVRGATDRAVDQLAPWMKHRSNQPETASCRHERIMHFFARARVHSERSSPPLAIAPAQSLQPRRAALVSIGADVREQREHL